jgi:tryptophanyl-tRNA synthetase
MTDIQTLYQGKGYGDFKKGLAQAISDYLEPIQEKINGYLADEASLKQILDQGAEKAKYLAETKMKLVREKIGVQL